MLTYISVEIENNPYRGGIEIHSTGLKSDVSLINKIRILRKRSGDTGLYEIYSINVNNKSNLSFNLFDITTMSGYTYTYIFDIMRNNTVIESETVNSIESYFEGLFVGNFEKQYIARANFKTETDRNTQVNYVTTLGSRTPYKVSNANSNYSNGTSSGLFLELTPDKKKFVRDYNRSYSNEVIDFLTDGSGKILKTEDGEMWFVGIDEKVSTQYNNNIRGVNITQFGWTEIGDVPIFGMVVDWWLLIDMFKKMAKYMK